MIFVVFELDPGPHGHEEHTPVAVNPERVEWLSPSDAVTILNMSGGDTVRVRASFDDALAALRGWPVGEEP